VPRLAILFGVLLILVGIGGYALGGDHKSPTALIPAAVGVLLAVCGAVVIASPSSRKHVMHAAATIGLLGFLAAAGRLLSSLMKGTVPPALTISALALMAGLCGLFVILCVGSFISARRRSPEQQAGFTPTVKD
jgi:hypothetical protein